MKTALAPLALALCLGLLSHTRTDARPANYLSAALTPTRSSRAADAFSVPVVRQPVQLPLRFRGSIICKRPVALTARVIALTFDDGPNPAVTPAVLRALKQAHAPATFFVIGEWAQEWPRLVTQAAAEGHAVESHSYSHPDMDVSLQHAERELEHARTVIEQYAGRKPVFFRPPWGNIQCNLAKVAVKQRQCVIRWTICGEDNLDQSPADIVKAVTANPQPGDVVLLHDGRGRNNTARALPEILRRLKAAGFQFVTLPQLLKLWDAALAKLPAAKPASRT